MGVLGFSTRIIAAILAATLSVSVVATEDVPLESSPHTESFPSPSKLEKAIEEARSRAKQAIDLLPNSYNPAGVSVPEDITSPERSPIISALETSIPEPSSAPPAIAVLVSFSMPEETLSALAAQSSRIGAPLVLRGLRDNSFRRTAESISQISKRYPEASNASWQVNPVMFEALSASSVPAFAVIDGDDTVAVTGDVSLDYALEYISRSHADGTAGKIALKHLGVLRP